SGLKTSVGYAQSRAVWAAGLNTANGTAVNLDTATDIEFGTWDPSTRTFYVLAGGGQSSATALRVYARRTTARRNPPPATTARTGRRTGSSARRRATGSTRPRPRSCRWWGSSWTTAPPTPTRWPPSRTSAPRAAGTSRAYRRP